MIQGSTGQSRLGLFHLKERRAFWRLTSVLFLVFLSGGLLSPILSVYTTELGASTFGVGLVVGAYSATSLLSQYWWGRRSDRIGRRKPLLLFGTAGLALVYLTIVVLQDWRWLLAVRIVEGVAFAAYSIGSLALIGDLLEDEQSRGRLMGLYRTFGSLAFSLAAFSTGTLADTFNIRVPIGLAALFYTLAFIVVTQISEPRADDSPQAEKVVATKQALPADPRARGALWPFLSLTVIWTLAMGSVVSLWPVYMQSIGYSNTAVGRLWGLAAGGEVICFLLVGYLADVWGRKRVLLLGIVCMAAVIFGYTLSSAVEWMVAVQILRSFAYAGFEAPAMLLATELGLRQQRGRLASLYYFASGIGGISGSVVGGAVAREFGLATMYRGVVCLMLIGAVATALLMPRLRGSVGRRQAAGGS